MRDDRSARADGRLEAEVNRLGLELAILKCKEAGAGTIAPLRICACRFPQAEDGICVVCEGAA